MDSLSEKLELASSTVKSESFFMGVEMLRVSLKVINITNSKPKISSNPKSRSDFL